MDACINVKNTFVLLFLIKSFVHLKKYILKRRIEKGQFVLETKAIRRQVQTEVPPARHKLHNNAANISRILIVIHSTHTQAAMDLMFLWHRYNLCQWGSATGLRVST